MFSALIEKITPEHARHLLELSHVNRKVNRRHVENLAREMRNGLWRLNGEPIVLSEDSELLDGQHRCEAIIESGVPIDCLVVRGIDRGAFDTLDNGRNRSFADVLSVDKEDNRFVLAGAASWLWKYYNDDLPQMAKKPSNKELRVFLEQHPGLRTSAEFVSGITDPNRLLPRQLAVFAHYVFGLEDSDKANEFISRVADGSGLTKDSPIWHLRERLIQRKTKKRHLHSRDVVALVIKAWNAFKTEEKIIRLRWAKNEQFPKVA